MPTILQLSEALCINVDQMTVLRYEDGQWLVFFHDHAHALTLTDEERLVLAHYLQKHMHRLSWQAVRREQGRSRYQETIP